jgi:phosphonopyruvate decarboxylase
MAFDPSAISRFLTDKGVSLVTGVPDSLLKSMIKSIDSTYDDDKHIVAPNEGAAIGLAIGHHLAGGDAAAVYLQNSGLGNAINPLLSLAHPQVYSIPMILFVGWRGAPGEADEPQHLKQGECTPDLLDAMGLWWGVLEPESDLDTLLEAAWQAMKSQSAPVVLLVKEGAFSASKTSKPVAKSTPPEGSALPTREATIARVLDVVSDSEVIVATTGKIGRELYELRMGRAEPLSDFLTVGGMGHASAISLGVALRQKQKRVICLDGDGALLMHMGTITMIGAAAPRNLIHIILNNGTHESVGGQKTVALEMDFGSISKGAGYSKYWMVRDLNALDNILNSIAIDGGPAMIEVIIQSGSRPNLGRPNSPPRDNKAGFMSLF